VFRKCVILPLVVADSVSSSLMTLMRRNLIPTYPDLSILSNPITYKFPHRRKLTVGSPAVILVNDSIIFFFVAHSSLCTPNCYLPVSSQFFHFCVIGFHHQLVLHGDSDSISDSCSSLVSFHWPTCFSDDVVWWETNCLNSSAIWLVELNNRTRVP
jgi:hypothetical protein